MGNLFQFIEPFLTDREVFRIGFIGVEGFTVDLGHRGHIMDALHTAFDLKARQAGVVEVRQVRQKAEVLRVKNIGSPFIFDNRKILTRPFFFNDVVLKAAALDALAAVGIAVALGEVVAEQAAAGIGNAHGAVDEAFEFHRRHLFVNGLDVSQADFAGHDDA